MKNISILLATLFISLPSLATFEGNYVENKDFYEVTQYYTEKVNKNLDYFLELKYRKYPVDKFLDIKDAAKDAMGLLKEDQVKLKALPKTNRMAYLADALFAYEGPFFCHTLSEIPESFGDEFKFNTDCMEVLKDFVGKALDSADGAYLLSSDGINFGQWINVDLILLDYTTKETLTISFDILHEI